MHIKELEKDVQTHHKVSKMKEIIKKNRAEKNKKKQRLERQHKRSMKQRIGSFQEKLIARLSRNKETDQIKSEMKREKLQLTYINTKHHNSLLQLHGNKMGNSEEMNSKKCTVSQLYIESRRNRKYEQTTYQ